MRSLSTSHTRELRYMRCIFGGKQAAEGGSAHHDKDFFNPSQLESPLYGFMREDPKAARVGLIGLIHVEMA